MKKKFLEMLRKKEERKAALGTKASAATTVEELRSINAELDSLNAEIAEMRSMIDAMPDDEDETEQRGQQPGGAPEQRGGSPVGATQILGSYGVGGQPQQRGQEPEDPFSTVEYRSAFMEFAKTGVMKPELRSVMEQRANAMTTTADVSAVIPTTILNEVVKKLTMYGQVFSRVRKFSIQGGVDIPILSLKPVATWIGEAPVSDKQKVQANTKVSFSYYGLECRVSISLLANTATLAGFETTITDLIVEAMIKAVDQAVIKGDGVGKALGIAVDPRIPAAQVVTLTDAEIATYDGWKKKVTSKLPLSYKAGASFLMASGTFESYIDGMVDANGQPIGRVNLGITDAIQERFAGKEVIQVEDDVIAPFDAAVAGDVVTIYGNLRNYGFNSNMQMQLFRYLDQNTNEWVDKAILICDGKVIDPNGFVVVKKA